jgi:hypothetical protein
MSEISAPVSDASTVVAWKHSHENILIGWADKAMCYKWLHAESRKKYTVQYHWLTIPVIVMSTVTGAANFAQERVPVQYRTYAQLAIGGVNILAGVLTTVSQFLKVSELVEAHRSSTILWDRFYRTIQVELSKERHNRTAVVQFLATCQEQYDMLMETSPIIHDDVVLKFNRAFRSNKATATKSEKERQYYNFLEVQKPDICNELVSARHSMACPPKGVGGGKDGRGWKDGRGGERGGSCISNANEPASLNSLLGLGWEGKGESDGEEDNIPDGDEEADVEEGGGKREEGE